LIFTAFGDAGSSQCNVTGWYVEPEYNSYAALFALRAFQRKDVTYINISARPVARPIIKAQGFAQYSRRQFVALPGLHLTCDAPTKVISVDTEPDVAFYPGDRDLLAAHAQFGYRSVWCLTAAPIRSYSFRACSNADVWRAAHLLARRKGCRPFCQAYRKIPRSTRAVPCQY
jgi:hypothetical protein